MSILALSKPLNRFLRSFVFIFAFSILYSVDRPIPFLLGFVFSICFSKQLVAFKFVEANSIFLFHVLVGLLFVLGFDFIRLTPRDFQLFLFSKRDILILVWALAGSMLVARSYISHANALANISLRWTFGSIVLLLALNLPILREINSRIGIVHFLQRPQIEFVVLAFIIVIVSLRIASGLYSLPLFAWQLSSCWMFLCDSRFFSAISFVNLLLFTSILLSAPRLCKTFAYGMQFLLFIVFSLIFPILPFFIPLIQRSHFIASFLYRSTGSRAFDTWSINLWHEDALDLATHWPQWISHKPGLLMLSPEYRLSVFNTSISPYVHINHAHSLPLQQLLLFDPASGSLFDVLVATLPLIIILLLMFIALVIRLKYQFLTSHLGFMYNSTILLIVGYISTESVSFRNVLPLIFLLPIIQSFGSQRFYLAPVQAQGLSLSTGVQYFSFLLRSPLALLLAVASPVTLYCILYLS